jgi:hypothetical protein
MELVGTCQHVKLIGVSYYLLVHIFRSKEIWGYVHSHKYAREKCLSGVCAFYVAAGKSFTCWSCCKKVRVKPDLSLSVPRGCDHVEVIERRRLVRVEIDNLPTKWDSERALVYMGRYHH